MIDRGLLLTLAVMAVAAPALVRLARPRTQEAGALIDSALAAMLAGVLVARVVAMALDDPTGLTRVRDILVIRGGVEFWPGVVAAMVVLTTSAWRAGAAVVPRLADLSPFALWEYALYEAACLVRDGCFGPHSLIGVAPGGLGSRQLPVGVLVGVAMAALGVLVRRLAAARPVYALLVAVGGVALVRSVASFWLPKIGTSLTRQHIESLAVTAAAVAAIGAHLLASGRRADAHGAARGDVIPR